MAYTKLINAGAALVLACNANTAGASQLSPCLRVLTYEHGKFGQEPIRFINQCSLLLSDQEEAAVHEHMTAASIFKYRKLAAFAKVGDTWKLQYMYKDRWTADLDKPGQQPKYHQSHAIMFGTWWNDDPLMRSWGQGLLDFVFGSLNSWRAIKHGVDDPRRDYPGGTLFCRVDAAVHLGRASHLGRLQHLHFMTTLPPTATPSERVKATTDAALNWLEFAYSVATGKVAPDSSLTPERQAELGLPSIALNHCVQDPSNVKIRTLFSRLGQTDEYRNGIVPDVALGSMLHVIQDSFSPSHTCRVLQPSGTTVIAALADVENYNEQDKDAHRLLDGIPDWLKHYADTAEHLIGNDPITVGAWLLAAVDQDLPWKEVKDHLRSTVFAPMVAQHAVHWKGREACQAGAWQAGQ